MGDEWVSAQAAYSMRAGRERDKGDTSGRDWGDSAAIGWARFVKENQYHVRQAGGLRHAASQGLCESCG